jgi:hypothetical protein
MEAIAIAIEHSGDRQKVSVFVPSVQEFVRDLHLKSKQWGLRGPPK